MTGNEKKRVKFKLWNLVQKEAKRLDDISEGWEEKINLDNFDMISCERCVGHYLFKITSYPEILFRLEIRGHNVFAFGFKPDLLIRSLGIKASILSVPKWYHETLNKYWRKMITQRLQK